MLFRSGTAANLEMAIQVIKHTSPVNKVLFAFWGAEELGLLGSKYFVNTLDEKNLSDIALNLNFDMIVRILVLLLRPSYIHCYITGLP